MSELNEQDCADIDASSDPLTADEIGRYLVQLDPQWTHDEVARTISYHYPFKNFYQTIAFVNVIAQIAHQQDHHPDLHVGYNRCTVTYSTHSAGGLTLKDFICAAKINHAQRL